VLLKTREAAEELERAAPFTAAVEGKPSTAVAYLCRGGACELPTDDPDRFMKLLLSSSP
jgi:uncharacterized protein YyaL (SSP411 family)